MKNLFAFLLLISTLTAYTQTATNRLYEYYENDNTEYGEPTALFKGYREFIRTFSQEELGRCDKNECLVLDIFYLWIDYAHGMGKEQSAALAEDLKLIKQAGIDFNKKYPKQYELMFSRLFFTMVESLDEINEEVMERTQYETIVKGLLAVGIDFNQPMGNSRRWFTIPQYLVSLEDTSEYPSWLILLEIMLDSKVNLQVGHDKRWSPFMMSIVSDRAEAFDLFLKKGLNVNYKEGTWTTFELAVYGTDTTDLGKVEKIINAGYDVNRDDHLRGMSALMIMAYADNPETEEAKALIEQVMARTKDLNATDAKGNTVLHHAVRTFNPWICHYVGGEVDQSIKNKKGKTALEMAEDFLAKSKYATSNQLKWFKEYFEGPPN